MMPVPKGFKILAIKANMVTEPKRWTGCFSLESYRSQETKTTSVMLRWVLTFLVIALVAGILGFTGISEGAADIAKVIFYIFLVLLVIALLFGSFIWKKVS